MLWIVTNDGSTPKRRSERRDYVGTPGHAIRVRRAELDLTREGVSDATRGHVSPKTIQRYETNEQDLSVMNLNTYRALLEALRWTATDFQRATGVNVRAPEIPGAHEYRSTIEVTFVGAASAGLGHDVEMNETHEMVPLDARLPGLMNRAADTLRLVSINGNSMVSENAAKGIVPGSMVVVEIDAVPRDNDIVVAWLPEREAVVVKRFREDSDAILRSISPRGPVFRVSEEDIEVRGVVRTVIFNPNA
jgi:SOS-response transcriptional repressor LexA